jgi:integrase
MPRKSTRSPAAKPARPFRPDKPYKGFPLGATSTGFWQKRIAGRLHYFGKWAKRVDGQLVPLPNYGVDEALLAYKAHVNGQPVDGKSGAGLTIRDLCNYFLTSKQNLVESGDLATRTFAEYKQTTDILFAQFGRDRLVESLRPIDFETLRAKLSKRWGPVRLGNAVQRVKTVFRYAFEAELIDRLPRFGPQFKKPTKKVMRKHRNEGGEKVFTADEIRRMLAAASVPLRAMFLLGINCAFGNADCGELPLSAVDLDGGWIKFPRPKTGVTRRAALWPETVEALRLAIAERPDPKDAAHAGLVFITKYGRPWSTDGTSDAVSQETRKVLDELHINGRRNLGFYGLRHTFRTVADATLDFPAVRLVMGHTDASIDATYADASRIEDARLRAVADHVHGWLFTSSAEGGAR